MARRVAEETVCEFPRKSAFYAILLEIFGGMRQVEFDDPATTVHTYAELMERPAKVRPPRGRRGRNRGREDSRAASTPPNSSTVLERPPPA